MRRALRWATSIFGLLLVALMLLLAHTIWMKPLKIGWFYERVFAEIMLQRPELLSSLRILPPWLAWYSDDLTDASPAYEARYAEIMQSNLAMLRRYNREALPADGRIDYDILEYFLAINAEGERFQYHNYPMNQLEGVQKELPTFLATQHPVHTVEDAEDYLTRLDKFPVKLDQVLESVRLRESRGIVPPTFVVEKVLEGMRAFVATVPEQNILYTSFEQKLAELPTEVRESERVSLRAAVSDAIRDKVYPSYGKLIAYYEEVLPKTPGNHGVWALPDGDAFYAYQVRLHTTTNMTPKQVHAMGLAEVARIEAEMDAVLRAEGETAGSVGDRMGRISERPEQHYPDSVEAETIVADYQAIVDEIEGGLDDWFDLRPKASVKVERMPMSRETGGAFAKYDFPAMDGSRPGVFNANLRDPSLTERFSMRTLAYHEAIPGHHYQVAMQMELSGVPTFRKLVPLTFTAFVEGWALYAERVAWEAGFQGRPLDNLGRLHGELFRAVRLVVDTGLHHKRWSREHAVDYMREKLGPSSTFDIEAEVERYMVIPGQALAYKVGMNRILELRTRARKQLDDKFDIRRFHTLLLTNGGMPMTMLEQRVDAWIAEEQQR